MNSFLANLASGPFDWVIIDTPPVLAVTDAVILAPHVSAVVFVIGSEMTRRVHAERALETLRTSRPRSIAAVLNRVDFDRNKYYYSRYYGYQYKSYYGAAARPPAPRNARARAAVWPYLLLVGWTTFAFGGVYAWTLFLPAVLLPAGRVGRPAVEPIPTVRRCALDCSLALVAGGPSCPAFAAARRRSSTCSRRRARPTWRARLRSPCPALAAADDRQRRRRVRRSLVAAARSWSSSSRAQSCRRRRPRFARGVADDRSAALGDRHGAGRDRRTG